LALGQFRPFFAKLITDGMKMNTDDFCLICLYFATYLLIGFWLWSTWYELDKIIYYWLDRSCYTPPESIKDCLFIFSFVAFLCTLLFSIKNILVFSILFSGYSLAVLLICCFYTNNEIGKAVDKCEAHLKKAIESLNKIHPEEEQQKNKEKYKACGKALTIIKKYWCDNLQYRYSEKKELTLEINKYFFCNWQFIRGFYILIGSLAILVFIIIGKIHQIPNWKTISYFCLSFLIFSLRNSYFNKTN
jgi:hypothetical protein